MSKPATASNQPRSSTDVIGRRNAELQPQTFNEVDNSVELIWTTGAAVTRFDWWDDEFYDETLATDDSAVRLERLNAGAPALLDHVTRSEALIGSVVPGSARMLKGKGIARVRLADTPDVADAVAKVKAGHLRNISVGYVVHTYERHTYSDGRRAEMRATDWEPMEISFTPVPADPGCQTRARSTTEMPPQIIERSESNDDEIELPSTRRSGVVSAKAIKDVCRRGRFSRAFEEELLEEHEDRPFSRRALELRINTEYAEMNSVAPIDNSRVESAPNGGNEAIAMRDAMVAKIAGRSAEGQAAEYRGMSVVDMARHWLSRSGARGAHRLTPDHVVRDAMSRRSGGGFVRDIGGTHGTSDFVDLIGSAAEIYLIERYRALQSPLKVLARRRDRTNFLKHYGVQVGGMGTLEKVNEHGEFKNRTIDTRKEGYAIETYGNMFGVTRQVLINDELGALADTLDIMAAAATETEATLLAALINSNPLLSDGKPWFHADHGNLAIAGGAPSIATLDAGRFAMRSQKGLDGTSLLDARPKYLLLPAQLETTGEILLASTTPSNSDDVNPFSGKLTPIADPRLASAAAWWLFADPASAPALQYSYLDGQETPFLDSRDGWRVDGTEFKVRHDFGAGVMDHRMAYKNPGASPG